MNSILALANSDLTAYGSAMAAIVAAVTGVTAYKINRKTVDNEKTIAETVRTADLNKAEVEGWTALIKNLMEQYTAAAKEAGELRAKLAEANVRYEALEERFNKATERIAVLEAAMGGRRAEDPPISKENLP